MKRATPSYVAHAHWVYLPPANDRFCGGLMGCLLVLLCRQTPDARWLLIQHTHVQIKPRRLLLSALTATIVAPESGKLLAEEGKELVTTHTHDMSLGPSPWDRAIPAPCLDRHCLHPLGCGCWTCRGPGAHLRPGTTMYEQVSVLLDDILVHGDDARRT